MLPGAFLVANILLVFAIRSMLGFSPPDFPLELHWSATFPLDFLRYLLGFLVLLAFLLLFVSRRDFPQGMILIAPVACYASVVYLPLLSISMLLSSVSGHFFLNSIASLFDFWASWASIGDGRLPPIEWVSFVLSIVLIIFYAAGVLWWLYLIHLGLKLIPLQLPYTKLRKLLWAWFCYLLTKTGSIVLVMIILYSNTIVTDFYWIKLKEVISEDPLKCGSAFISAQRIIGNDTYPIYPRYIAYIISATCSPVFLLQGDETRKKVIERAITAIKESKFEVARGILEEYMSEVPKAKVNVGTIMVKSNLKEANKLYESPMYLEWRGTEHSYGIPPAPIALFP